MEPVDNRPMENMWETPMAHRNGKLICERCGDEMNHHADKLVYTTESDTPAKAGLALGGSIEEFHACPGCGAVASRRTESASDSEPA